MHTAKPFFFLVGKPASGKETQARLLAEKLAYPLFISGARFRDLMASETYLGKRIRRDYETGALLPAWVADYLFEHFVLNLDGEEGAIFEGSGRDLEQVETIERVTKWLGRPYQVFHLKVSDETVITRSLARGRDLVDTNEDALRTRLSDYARLTEPAIQRFTELRKAIEIDGEKSREEIHDTIMKHAHQWLS